jgi:hypothetical protein
MLLHLNGNVIRTTVDHALYVESKSWINAAGLPGQQFKGEQVVVYNLGDQAMPDFPIIGFVAGTLRLTCVGKKRI